MVTEYDCPDCGKAINLDDVPDHIATDMIGTVCAICLGRQDANHS